MRGARKALAMAMCRPSCGWRNSSEEVTAILSWAGELARGYRAPRARNIPLAGARYPEGCMWH
eukprot:8470448-Pyramimonas_sp.AAC.1